jgi:hypothetical protein
MVMSIRTYIALVIMFVAANIHGFGSEDLEGFDQAVYEAKQSLLQAWHYEQVHGEDNACKAMVSTILSAVIVSSVQYGAHYVCTIGECFR